MTCNRMAREPGFWEGRGADVTCCAESRTEAAAGVSCRLQPFVRTVTKGSHVLGQYRCSTSSGVSVVSVAPYLPLVSALLCVCAPDGFSRFHTPRYPHSIPSSSFPFLSRFFQVVGTFSDSESPSDDVEETSPRARAAAAAGSGSSTSPRPKTLPFPMHAASSPGAVRLSSPINTTPTSQQVPFPSPLPNIQAGGAEGAIGGGHFQGAASPRPGYSPGVDSTREYSESDDDDTPGGGMLKGEGLIP